MKKSVSILPLSLAITIIVMLNTSCTQKRQTRELAWPEISMESKPWTRWWWMGSAVNRTDLTAVMEEYHKAGLGGVEISPIYGVTGHEDQFIQYLSPEWMDVFTHTLDEADRLGMGVDMICGTGWPFGGPWIKPEDACAHSVFRTFTLNEGDTIDLISVRKNKYRYDTHGRYGGEKIRFAYDSKPLPLLVLMAHSDKGDRMDLTGRVDGSGKLNWTAPRGKWTLYAVFLDQPCMNVKNAAPGGKGSVMDHFSGTALNHYLARFDSVFEGHDIRPVRAFFNDSYEVNKADWTAKLAGEFLERRGYDLYDHLPALFSEASEEENIRVFCDYRTTISELMLEEFTEPWTRWAHDKAALTRNQAHGSPGNIVDLYAASDIPETETKKKAFMKLASSAAHIAGKKLTSSESCVWLNEHFLSTLAEARESIDKLFLAGGNHVFYHGTNFSPQSEIWPGWIFYASVHFGPTNPIWNDFPALNEYVTRCQSFLQSGVPDNELLFYYPFYDLISEYRGYISKNDGTSVLAKSSLKFVARNETLLYYPDALMLIDRGYSFDYISDRYIEQLAVKNRILKTGNSSYRALILSPCKYIPVETFDRLIRLANEGAVIIVHGSLPGDVPGLSDLEHRQIALQELKDRLVFEPVNGSSVLQAETGKGSFLLGENLDELLSVAGIEREAMVDRGLQFIRRKDEQGSFYFIVNQGIDTIDGWIPVQQEFRSAGLFDPSNGNCGLAAVRKKKKGMEVYLQLLPGESCIIKLFDAQVRGLFYEYVHPVGEARRITGPWKVSFISGGPELPDDMTLSETGSWTEFNIEALMKFSGQARYSVNFSKPEGAADGWLLNLGRVAESARVKLNGKNIGTVIGPNFYIRIPDAQLEAENLLEIDVSNLMANRIADLDRKTGGSWRKFRLQGRTDETRGPGGFSAASWEPRESGLIGPVTLTPLDYWTGK